MADLIKKIKIKKQDGTFTDYIPIGADAVNIETSDGESVQLKLNKKPYYYTNVASMRADTKLKIGDMAITLGYYETNDGGGAKYQIVNNSELVDDGGSVYELNNGLKAELIVENNEVNIKQFGAKGDGEHDDTTNIQNAIEYLFNKFNNDLQTQMYLHKNVLYMPSGIYRITDTIDFPNILRLYITGNTELLVDEDNISGMWINSRGLARPNTSTSDSNRHDPGTGKLICSNGGQLIIRKKNYDYDSRNILTTQSVGLEVGDRTGATSVVSTARCTIENISIHGFNTGLAINAINMYIANFERIYLESNNNDIVWGYSENFSNSGEKITFDNCVIAGSIRGVLVKKVFSQIAFNNCSFDFNANPIFVDVTSRGLITVTGGHLESVGHPGFGSEVRQLLGFGYFLYYNSTSNNRLTLKISNIINYISTGNTSTNVNYKFGTAKQDAFIFARNLEVYLDGFKAEYDGQLPVKINTMFLADKNTNIYYNSFPVDSNSGIYFGSQNIDKEGTFEYYTDSNITNYRINTESGTTLEIYNSSNKNADDEEPIFNNALRLSRTAYGSGTRLIREFHSLKSKKIRVASIFALANVEIEDTSIANYTFYNTFVFTFYGKNNTLIGGAAKNLEVLSKTITSDNNKWRAAIGLTEIPPDCEYMKVTAAIRLRDTDTNTYISRWKGVIDFAGFMADFCQ